MGCIENRTPEEQEEVVTVVEIGLAVIARFSRKFHAQTERCSRCEL